MPRSDHVRFHAVIAGRWLVMDLIRPLLSAMNWTQSCPMPPALRVAQSSKVEVSQSRFGNITEVQTSSSPNCTLSDDAMASIAGSNCLPMESYQRLGRIDLVSGMMIAEVQD